MKTIETVKDLREWISRLSYLDDNVKVIFDDRFNQYNIDMNYIYDHNTNTVSFQCEKVGSILEGTHRVLGKD